MDKGKKILFAMFGNGKLWKNGNITKEDYEYAENAGYLFKQPAATSHEEALCILKTLQDRIDARNVSNAFLYSLSTRALEYRSALGSYYYAIAIPNHEVNNSQHCSICSWYGGETGEYSSSSYNALNFERYKWGGVRHTNLNYALFDLEQFLKLPKVLPSKEDVYLVKEILACVQDLEPKVKPENYAILSQRKKLLKTNKEEIKCILEILGICGILAGKDYPGYNDKFLDEYGRAPNEHTNDMEYPINHWYAKDGINFQRFEEVFGFPLDLSICNQNA